MWGEGSLAQVFALPALDLASPGWDLVIESFSSLPPSRPASEAVFVISY